MSSRDDFIVLEGELDCDEIPDVAFDGQVATTLPSVRIAFPSRDFYKLNEKFEERYKSMHQEAYEHY